MKIIVLSLAAIGCLFVVSCKKVEKDFDDYYPQVKTVSAVMQQDGSVRITGQLISEGAGGIHYVGFCSDTSANPTMMDNQQLADLDSGDIFYVDYTGLEIYKKYYFRSFATNGYGYNYGNIIYIDSILPENVTPPCSPTKNSMVYHSQQLDFYFVGAGTWALSYGGYGLTANGHNADLSIEFLNEPYTGKYITIQGSGFIQPKECIIYGVIGGGYKNAAAGDTVYVIKNGEGKYTVSFCDIHFDSYPSNGNLTTE